MTDSSTIQKRLIELASKRFGVDADALGPKDDFFDKLGIDSYQAMELLTDVEAEFDVEIPDYELQGVTTFEGMAEVIGRRV